MTKAKYKRVMLYLEGGDYWKLRKKLFGRRVSVSSWIRDRIHDDLTGTVMRIVTVPKK